MEAPDFEVSAGFVKFGILFVLLFSSLIAIVTLVTTYMKTHSGCHEEMISEYSSCSPGARLVKYEGYALCVCFYDGGRD